jgi:hypothetical protein
MTAAPAALPGNLSLSEDANVASWTAVLDVRSMDECILTAEPTVQLKLIFGPSRFRGTVVELRPRTFRETANHFLQVATPVVWPPNDEADID